MLVQAQAMSSQNLWLIWLGIDKPGVIWCNAYSEHG